MIIGFFVHIGETIKQIFINPNSECSKKNENIQYKEMFNTDKNNVKKYIKSKKFIFDWIVAVAFLIIFSCKFSVINGYN